MSTQSKPVKTENAKSYTWRFLSEPDQAVASAAKLRELILRQRGVGPEQQETFVSPDYSGLHGPGLLSGVGLAVERMNHALANGQKIVVYGDYDIDGITATALLVDVLSQLGAQVRPYIPDRFEEGYGLNLAALKALKADGADLLISVDCGITAAHEVAEAAKFGLDIIVTDHHTVPEVTPKAAIACINPRLPGDEYPFKDLAGVAVAFKLAVALAATHPGKVKPGREKWLLDLVALGTVCDVVPLVEENRALVQFGLTVLRKSPRPGLRALAEASGVELSSVQASDLGFRFGPRLNAAGRLEHAAKALELITTTSTDRAKELAEGLNTLNRERQDETARMFAEAMQQSEDYPDDAILVLSGPDWSHGIVGLVASRVSEARHKPTIILQELGDTTKGSARSIGTFNIIEAITSAKQHLERYGGHAFAAGMTLKTSKVADLRKALNEYAAQHESELSTQKELIITCQLAGGLLNTQLLTQLEALEPYGNANPQPVFASKLKLVRMRPVGADQKHLQMSFEASVGQLGAIAFSAAGRWPWLELGQLVEVAYRASKNVWQGVESLQLEVVDIRPIGS